MKLIMVDNNGKAIELDPAAEGSYTTARMLEVFGKAIQLQRMKASTYSEAWREQGYMGNVARVLSKASRLKNMVWRDSELSSADESVFDTALDMINLLGFFIINKDEGNRWGK